MGEPDLIIIGAARSGTNALRDALCSMPAFHTWPCDEINYIWRTGNRDAPTDELSRTDARPEVVHRIRRAFERRRRHQPHRTLVEKTCANTLRVGFVDEVVPDARFLHIVRDGRDVIASARQRWTASLDIPYLARKARFVPLRDLPFYGARYLKHRVLRLRSSEERLPTWGPRFEGMDELIASGTSLEEICAAQWAVSVSTALDQLEALPAERVLQIRYEDLVADPRDVLDIVASFAVARPSRIEVDRAASTIKVGSVGSWRSSLDTGDHAAALDRAAAVLHRLGYE